MGAFRPKFAFLENFLTNKKIFCQPNLGGEIALSPAMIPTSRIGIPQNFGAVKSYL